MLLKAHVREPVIDADATATGRATSTSALKQKRESPIVLPSQTTIGTALASTATLPETMTETAEVAKTHESVGVCDVSEKQRKQKAISIRQKFDDVFQVSSYIDCGSINTDYSDVSDDINVNASLSEPKCIEFFKKLGASQFIIDTLTHGHKPVFNANVPPFQRKNNRSFFEHRDSAIKDIKELIKKGKVSLVKEKPYFCNPLSVAVQRNKKRFILDCSELNKYIDVPKFKYEDVKEAMNYFKKGCKMFTYDLKNGYHIIKIHKDFRKYLGFSFELEGKVMYAVYNVGPFGLCDLPFLFTKIFRVLVRHWRSCSMPVVKFLDDGICFGDNDEEAEEFSIHVRKDLYCAGAFWSVKKSHWEPSHRCEWLGLIWNSDEGSIAAAPHRVDKIQKTTSELLSVDVCHIKALASFVGQINSLSVVVGNCSALTTRCSQQAIAAADTWHSQIVLSHRIKQELNFWQENLESLNKGNLVIEKPPCAINIIESDASDSGCGSLLNSSYKALRLFSGSERSMHSTYRELVAVSHAVNSFLPQIAHSKVKIRVDNQSAARIIDVGSMKDELHSIAMEVFFTCLKNGVSLEIEWIPRTLNEAADAASREAQLVDTDDWQLEETFFSYINNRWGPLTVDYFSNDYNKKLSRFYSLFNSPGCEGVDAFAHDWSGEMGLFVPPVCLAGRVLLHLKLCKAKGVLIVPDWPSAHYYPLLLREFRPFILDCIRFKGKNVLRHGYNTNSLLGSKDFLGNILGLFIDCS